jgi:long-chain acyl-CoA synthetase
MEAVWQKHYSPGVDPHIHINSKETLVDMFHAVCERYAERTAFYCEGETLTFAELRERAIHLAAYFQKELKLSKGDHVAIMLPNVLQYPIVLFAVLMCGCIAVNLNPLDKAGNLLHQLKDSEALAIIVIENFISELEQVVHQTQVKHIIFTSFGAMFKPLKGMVVNFVMRHIKRMVPKWHLEETIDYTWALEKGKELQFDAVDIAQTDTAFLQYTGGTTGFAKGAVLTHRNMLANLLQAKAITDVTLNHKGEIVVTALPLYHIFSLLANLLLFLKYGAENVLIPNPRDVKAMVKSIKNRPYTAMTGVNTLFNALLKNEAFRKSDFTPLKLVLGGGMAVQQVVADDWKQSTGVAICQAYGMTETSPAICINPTVNPEFNGSVGLPVPDTLVSVRDTDGKEVAIGERGELWVKGPQVMQGYWKREEENKKALTPDGWLRTGDVVVMNEAGFITIVDRLKDIIVVSGFKVYPAEIENCIRSIEGVVEVAVVGIPCHIKGEEVKAFVVKHNPNKPTADEIRAYCKKKLAGYKVPNQVTFVPELPKSNVGKILKRELRRETSCEIHGASSGLNGIKAEQGK